MSEPLTALQIDDVFRMIANLETKQKWLEAARRADNARGAITLDPAFTEVRELLTIRAMRDHLVHNPDQFLADLKFFHELMSNGSTLTVRLSAAQLLIVLHALLDRAPTQASIKKSYEVAKSYANEAGRIDGIYTLENLRLYTVETKLYVAWALLVADLPVSASRAPWVGWLREPRREVEDPENAFSEFALLSAVEALTQRRRRFFYD